MKITRALRFGLLVAALAGCGDDGGTDDTDGGDTNGSTDGGTDGDEAAFEGSWARASLTVDGSSETFCNAQLDLTSTSWHSYTTGGGAMFCDCDITGTMVVDGATMTWTTSAVSGQYCGVWSPGDVVTNTWMVSGQTLTLASANVVETYTRIDGGGGDDDSGGGETGSGTTTESCDRKNGAGACTDFTGAGWTEGDKAMYCTGGTLQTVACDTTNAVGSCLFDAGAATEYVMTFYSDGTPPFNPTGAESTCMNLGGTWMP